jgi:hypothetical protein
MNMAYRFDVEVHYNTRTDAGATRFVVEPDSNGFRVVDSRNGHLHSARIADKDRAQRQAVTMNEQAARHSGRLTGMLDGWKPGDTLEHVTTFPVFADSYGMALTIVFREMNRVDGDEWISTQNLPVRSMCKGDVVVLRCRQVFGLLGKAFVAEAFGWTQLSDAQAAMIGRTVESVDDSDESRFRTALEIIANHPTANAIDLVNEARATLGMADVAATEVMDDEQEQPDEGPSCSICDALGHGYPGGGPCPLEERGAMDADRDFDLYGSY